MDFVTSRRPHGPICTVDSQQKNTCILTYVYSKLYSTVREWFAAMQRRMIVLFFAPGNSVPLLTLKAVWHLSKCRQSGNSAPIQRAIGRSNCIGNGLARLRQRVLFCGQCRKGISKLEVMITGESLPRSEIVQALQSMPHGQTREICPNISRFVQKGSAREISRGSPAAYLSQRLFRKIVMERTFSTEPFAVTR